MVQAPAKRTNELKEWKRFDHLKTQKQKNYVPPHLGVETNDLESLLHPQEIRSVLL